MRSGRTGEIREEESILMTEAEFNAFSNVIKYRLAHKFPSAPGFASVARKLKTSQKKTDDTDIKQAAKEWAEGPVKALGTYVDIAAWDTREVTDTSELFKDAKDFDEDISRWDVSNVKKMIGMFHGATSFDKECF